MIPVSGVFVNFETKKILAERYLGTATAEDYVDWAVSCLEADLDTKNIRILASLRNISSLYEVEDYFKRCFKDLNLTMPDRRECLFQYARGVAQRILSGEFSPLYGCSLIYGVVRELGFPGEMISWVFLDDGMHPENLRELVGADWEETIRSEAARFVQESTS